MGDQLITVIVIDDHEIVRKGLRSFLAESDPPIHLVEASPRVASAWTGPGAAADVVVLDLLLGKNEPPVFGELRQLVDAGRRVVVYTGDTDQGTALRCIELGALAYVAKCEGIEHLVTAIRAAARDDGYTPPSLSGALLTDDDPARPELTPREQAVLRAWCMSGSKSMVAGRLSVTLKAVDSCIQRVRAKYAAVGRPASTKSALVIRALEDGVITYAELKDQST
jgi:DNA-binding NarL/FixJ family response regulator